MTLVDYLTQLLGTAFPTATLIVTNGRGLEKLRSDSEVDDDELIAALSYTSFMAKEGYATEKGPEVWPANQPPHILRFTVLLRPPDDEDLQADGYAQVKPLLDAIRAAEIFTDDDGLEWEVLAESGSATTEPEYANDVFEITLVCG